MVTVKSSQEIEKIYRACQVVAETLLKARESLVPGVTTWDLDRIAEEYILSKGLKPAFKGYRGFKHTLCTSINEEVVHGIPSKKREILEGDLVSVDCGAIYEGYYGDSARSFAVGQVSEKVQKLLEVTQEALARGIAQMKEGSRLYDIGASVQNYAENHGFSVVRDYVGHGIGRQLHEDPQIPNYGKAGTGMRLKPGMVFAIEPMLNAGLAETKTLSDGWTVVTRDGQLSAHFEDTAVVGEKAPQILTHL
ncbi:MAG: type I methionyl aminopeptidase [Deltaproteobacteria bacterium]|nr:type I methionyl aminopeptidase [Deltaproteobacteria bacterium]